MLNNQHVLCLMHRSICTHSNVHTIDVTHQNVTYKKNRAREISTIRHGVLSNTLHVFRTHSDRNDSNYISKYPRNTLACDCFFASTSVCVQWNWMEFGGPHFTSRLLHSLSDGPTFIFIHFWQASVVFLESFIAYAFGIAKSYTRWSENIVCVRDRRTTLLGNK